MTLYDLLTKYAAYNTWANQRIIDWIKKYPEAAVSRETISSYPTIPQTLYHIWTAQILYLAMLEENEPAFPEESGYDEIMNGLSHSSMQLATAIESLGNEGLIETRYIERGSIKGDYPVFEFIHQCLNHSTYHRGQIITMGRSLGLESPPVTDYYRFSISTY